MSETKFNAIEMTWKDGSPPSPQYWFDLCKQIAGVYPDAMRVAIAISFEDGARVTFEDDKWLKDRMERE